MPTRIIKVWNAGTAAWEDVAVQASVGATGPAGPTGPTGPTGATGQAFDSFLLMGA